MSPPVAPPTLARQASAPPQNHAPPHNPAPPPPLPLHGAVSIAPAPGTAFRVPGMDQLLKWSGVVLLFLSAVFLVSTAIQRRWIGPEIQLAGAAAIGVGLIGCGLHLGAKKDGWDTPLIGAGLAVLAACSGAGWAWLELGERTIWTLAVLGVLGASAHYTAGLRSSGLGAVSTVAVLLAGAAVTQGVDEMAVMIAVVVVTMEATAAWIRRPLLHLFTVATGVASFGILLTWSLLDPDPAGARTLVAGSIVSLIFWFAPIWLRALERTSTETTTTFATHPAWSQITERVPLGLPVLFGAAVASGWKLSDIDAGRLFLSLGALGLLLAAGAFRVAGKQPTIAVTHGLAGMAALTVGSATLLDGSALLASLVAQSAALLVLTRMLLTGPKADMFANVQAALVTSAAALLAASGIAAGIASGVSVFDDGLHLLVIALVAGWAWAEHRRSAASTEAQGQPSHRELPKLLAAGAYGALLVWPLSALASLPQGQALVSTMWAAVGLIAIAAGFRFEHRIAANVGLATLALVVLKLLTVDLAAVDTFWRVLLFFGLGGVFLGTGYRTAREVPASSTSEVPSPPTR